MITEKDSVAWLGDRMAFYKEACVVLGNDTLTLFDERDLLPPQCARLPRGAVGRRQRPAPKGDGQD